MGRRQLALIRCESAIPWQQPFAISMQVGLTRLGIQSRITADRSPSLSENEGVFDVLLGTTFWRRIEEGDGDWLLIDRCSFGNTNEHVSLVWNGHGRRGDHMVPENHSSERWEAHGIKLEPYSTGKRTILCGQTESYSDAYPDLETWYDKHIRAATHFRKHPAGSNPTGLPEACSFDNCETLITLNSSVAVDALIQGIPTVAEDYGAMAYGYQPRPDREKLMSYLAWTQWSHDEIEQGFPIAHLFR